MLVRKRLVVTVRHDFGILGHVAAPLFGGGGRYLAGCCHQALDCFAKLGVSRRMLATFDFLLFD